MKQKQENMPAERLRLTTIIYWEGEWSPELLQDEVREQYRYCKISEYADRLKDTMIQNNIDPENVLYIAATEESLRAAQMLGLAVLGYDKRSGMESDVSNTLTGVSMVVEGFEEVDALFLERVYEREHHIPWEIARTERWILREFTMDDMDGLVELYDQPGVSYRIENGQKVPGYIEPLFPREEEEEYQRCYIENMYGYYAYGMWIVTENPNENEKDSPRIIGRAGLENRDYGNVVELEMGYVIDPGWQRRGIAYEVCSAIIEYAREHTGFERLNALTEADNTASIALLEKLGFVYLEDTDVSGNMTRRYVYNLRKSQEPCTKSCNT